MKTKFTLLLVILFSSLTTAFAQVEDKDSPVNDLPDVVETPAEDAPKPTPAAKPTTPADAKTPPAAPGARKPIVIKQPVKLIAPNEEIKGNGKDDVALTYTQNTCGNDLKSIAVVNKSQSQIMKVRIDVFVEFRGKVSKKSMLIDKLSPNEVRQVGCSGCIEKNTGTACTVYKIIAAAYIEQ